MWLVIEWPVNENGQQSALLEKFPIIVFNLFSSKSSIARFAFFRGIKLIKLVGLNFIE
jgi:hypothetical protein